MKPSEVKAFLVKAVGMPEHPAIFIWGPPGVGKSQVVAQVARATGRILTDLRTALLDPTDLRGIPFLKDGMAVWAPPSFLPRSDSKDKHLLFLDELNLAPLVVQHSAYQLVLDHRVGEYYLPQDCLIVAAGNRMEDRAGVRELPAPLANRFHPHINFNIDVEEWISWAMQMGITAEIISFVRLNTDMLFKFDPQRNEKAFPTPRSVAAADFLLKQHGNVPYIWEAVEGTTGKEWAAKFHAYLQIFKELPNVDNILAGKDATVPTRADLRYAVAAILGTKAQVQHLEAVLRYALKLPAEHGAFLIKLLTRRPGMITPLAKTPSWRAWKDLHKEFFITE